MKAAWRYLYGENPLHLLAMIGCFALVGYVVTMVVDDPSAWWLLVWFVGAVIAHDLVLYPLYALFFLSTGLSDADFGGPHARASRNIATPDAPYA